MTINPKETLESICVTEDTYFSEGELSTNKTWKQQKAIERVFSVLQFFTASISYN